MVDETSHELKDYKLYCFNGIPTYTLVCSGRFSKEGLKETLYDNNWTRLPVKWALHDVNTNEIEKPCNFELMKKIARILAKDTSFVRIDFYEINEELYFGEITFYPTSGFEKLEPEEWNYKFGSLLKLPKQ